MKIGVQNDLTALEAIQARTFVVLNLEEFQEFQEFNLLGRRPNDVQVAIAVCQQDPRCSCVEQFDSSRCQRREYFDHVKLADERSYNFDEGDCDPSLDDPLTPGETWKLRCFGRLTRSYPVVSGWSSARRRRRATINATVTAIV